MGRSLLLQLLRRNNQMPDFFHRFPRQESLAEKSKKVATQFYITLRNDVKDRPAPG
jgi:hypothetical protein